MGHLDLWKYYTTQHQIDFLLSLRLLGDCDWPAEKYLACLYAISNNTSRHYTAFTVQKQDGSARKLLAPDPILKKIQKHILRNILDGLPVSPYATAYRKGSGVFTNAAAHTGQRLILKMDITDFFGSITFPMVYRSAFPYACFPPSVATLLTNLCCHHDYLPQGAPTSAAISNLVMKPFDDYAGEWCRDKNILYTRYSDDLTFSGDFDAKPIINKMRSFLASIGFEINERKTKSASTHQRQSVTGIVVNEKLQVSRKYRDKLRQEIYYCRKYGVISHLHRMNDKRYLPPETAQRESYIRSLLGKVDFVLYVDPHNQYFSQARAYLQSMIIS